MVDDYLFFFYSQGESGGSSDSPERRGMRGICSTTASVATVRTPFRTPGRDRCQRLPAAPPRRALNPPRRRPRRRPGLGAAGGRMGSSFSPATLLRAKGRRPYRHGEGRVAIARQACDHERTPQSLYFVLVLHSRSRTMRAQNVRRGLIPSFAAPRAGLWPSPTRRRRKYTQDFN